MFHFTHFRIDQEFWKQIWQHVIAHHILIKPIPSHFVKITNFCQRFTLLIVFRLVHATLIYHMEMPNDGEDSHASDPMPVIMPLGTLDTGVEALYRMRSSYLTSIAIYYIPIMERHYIEIARPQIMQCVHNFIVTYTYWDLRLHWCPLSEHVLFLICG